MSVTVSDCLQLPALREAKVLAGRRGLNQYVSSVSVLEYAKIIAFAEELFLENELILTAFTSIKDNVDEQCKVIRWLHEVGEVGVVIYYVGYFLPYVAQEVLDLADKLEFPLIVMPPNTYCHRYSEVITEVLELVFEDRKKESRFVPALMDRIAKLKERQRNLASVLRILSDRLRCSLLLLESDGRELGLASWPMGANDDFLNVFRSEAEKAAGFPRKAEWNGHSLKLCRCFFDTENQKRLRLFLLGESEALSENVIKQAAEVIQLFGNIWNDSFRHEEADDLVRAILNDQRSAILRISANLHIDLRKIRIMWVLPTKTTDVNSKPEILVSGIAAVRSFLKENGKTALVDVFDDNMVVFMEDAKFIEIDKELARDFIASYGSESFGQALIWCGGLDSIQDVRLAYMLIDDYYSSARVIYPHRHMMTLRELTFAERCRQIMEQGERQTESFLSVLKPLCGQKDTEELLTTLSAYLIDADGNTAETGTLLYIHESTVKYRINKIQRRLGYEVSRMPGSYALYVALAIRRLQR